MGVVEHIMVHADCSADGDTCFGTPRGICTAAGANGGTCANTQGKPPHVSDDRLDFLLSNAISFLLLADCKDTMAICSTGTCTKTVRDRTVLNGGDCLETAGKAPSRLLALVYMYIYLT